MSAAVVIGAGVSGLATAALLAADGHAVTVVEGRDEIGGRAGTWERDGFRWDTGPSWYLMPEVFEHFFRLLGTTAGEQLDLVRLDPAYRVYTEGDPEPMDVRPGEDAVALFESVEPGSGARLERYLASAADAYELSIARFLYDPYGSYAGLRHPDLLTRMPRLAALLTTSLAGHVDRRFTDSRLRRLLQYPAVFLGGSPYEVPALYHLMSHLDLTAGVLYPQGGFGTLIAAIHGLARRQGARVVTSAPVDRILTAGGRAIGVRVADGREVAADIVVSTADLHHTETELLPEELRSLPERWWQRRTPSPGALLLLLGVQGRLPQLAHHTLLFTEDWRGGFERIFGGGGIPAPASLYVCRPSATDPTAAPDGCENLFVLVPVSADPGLGRGGVDGTGDRLVERAADAVIAQLAHWCGIPDLAARVTVRRTIAPGDFAVELNAWRGNALGLAHTLRQSAVFRPRNASARVEGLFYAGASVLPGIGLPMCLISAELVAKRVRGDLSAGPLPEPHRAAAPGREA